MTITKLREVFGPAIPIMLGPFVALTAVVAATTRVKIAGAEGADAGDPLPGKAGLVRGIMICSEAGASFQVGVAIDGTVNSGSLQTVAGANKTAYFSTPVPFTALETVGVITGTSTTPKDLAVWLLVELDVSGE